MIIISSAPADNTDFGLGEPFDRRAGLLIAHQDARKQLQRVQVDGTRADIRNAEWEVTDILGKLEQHERDTADALLFSLRMAVRHYPQSLADLLAENHIVAGQGGEL